MIFEDGQYVKFKGNRHTVRSSERMLSVDYDFIVYALLNESGEIVITDEHCVSAMIDLDCISDNDLEYALESRGYVCIKKTREE